MHCDGFWNPVEVERTESHGDNVAIRPCEFLFRLAYALQAILSGKGTVVFCEEKGFISSTSKIRVFIEETHLKQA